MSRFIIICVFLGCGIVFSQNKNSQPNKTKNDSLLGKATIDMYKVISLSKDTTYVDTSLTIKSDYRFNYLRKDNFGLMPFANVGQTYNRLYYSLKEVTYLPEFGFNAKHFNYLESKDVQYYHVPTAYSQLYYRSVMEQGQNVDAFFTINPSENFNFSIAYKGLRSIGKYINVLSSTGNFRFTTSYHTTNKKYNANAHVVYQDIYNAENAGIKNISEFEGGESTYKERGTIDVNIRDANTMLKGNRFFLDHSYLLNSYGASNNFKIHHQIMADKRFFRFTQTSQNNYFGTAYIKNQISDRTDFRQISNQVALSYSNRTLGEIKGWVENIKNNYYYTTTINTTTQVIPNIKADDFNFIGGQYVFDKRGFKTLIKYTNGLDDSSINHFIASTKVNIWRDVVLSASYQKINKIPDYQNSLYQSRYVSYNWSNSLVTEKYNQINFQLQSKIINLSGDLKVIQDMMYFSNDSNTAVQVSPKQYAGQIGYASLKVDKEFKLGKFALDNSLLYQHVTQSNLILNLPDFVVRSTLYFSDKFFKKALYLQMGVGLNYFSSYYSDIYNPLIGSFYIQDQQKIGDSPIFDLFVNAKVKTARLYLKVEHVNSSFSKDNYYSAPNNPYRDFVIRFGIEWAFFN